MPRLWGSDPRKTGGKEYRADPEISDDQGPLTCGTCRGTGIVTREHRNEDAEDRDAKTDHNEKTCSTCGGSGKIR
jgi:DnaJ-class molecular chaperone